jgi:hypothetical protein
VIDEESRVVRCLIEHRVLLKPEEGSITGVEALELTLMRKARATLHDTRRYPKPKAAASFPSSFRLAAEDPRHLRRRHDISAEPKFDQKRSYNCHSI